MAHTAHLSTRTHTRTHTHTRMHARTHTARTQHAHSTHTAHTHTHTCRPAGINLWDEHIPARTLVVLGGRDVLAPTRRLQQWLMEHTHAQVCVCV
jgi:hypothetical protein